MKIPKSETLRVSYGIRASPVFLLTEDRAKNAFVLYEMRESGPERLGRAASPAELEEKFRVYERLEELAED